MANDPCMDRVPYVGEEAAASLDYVQENNKRRQTKGSSVRVRQSDVLVSLSAIFIFDVKRGLMEKNCLLSS